LCYIGKIIPVLSESDLCYDRKKICIQMKANKPEGKKIMKQFGTKVYIASVRVLEDDHLFEQLYQTVSKERQEKIDRLRFSKDKRLSLAAAVLLRKALEQNGVYEYEIKSEENGKPYLIGEETIKFNLSHSEERVMCVLSDQETGCDVEKIRDTDYKVAKHFFAPEEWDMLERAAAQGQEEKQKMFFRLWTLKESFIKAIGLGMGLSMKDFHFFIQDKDVHVYQNVSREQYYFKEYDLKDGYRYAVCSMNPAFAEIEKVDLA